VTPAVGTVRDGLRLGAATFTVLPVRPATMSPDTARVAMASAPGYGLLIGAATAGLALLLRAGHAPTLLTAVACVGLTALATRGLHLDGLADTVDALGAYRDRERALAVMKSPEVGPFGVAAIVFALLVPTAAIAGVLSRPWWAVLCTLAAGYGTSRAAATWSCRPGVPAARRGGLGVAVAGLVPVPLAAAVTVPVAAVALAAVPHRIWQGPVAVLAGLAAGLLVTRHATRRFGGITGDTLGASVEVATAVTLAALAW
jgi:adenosylcobinamide-GDP ribazoletransferase